MKKISKYFLYIKRLVHYWIILKKDPSILTKEDREALNKFDIKQSKIIPNILEIRKEALIDHIGIRYSDVNHYYQFGNRVSLAEITHKLSHHYTELKPKSLAEVFSYRINHMVLTQLPASFFANGMPWSTNKRLNELKRSIENSININCAHFGPCERDFIEQEAARLKRSIDKIARNGYKPGFHPDGYIRGFIITNGDKYSFVVTAGKHRASACINASRDGMISVRLNPGFIPIVHLDKVSDLPQVKSGLYPQSAALDLINLYANLGVKTGR